VFVFARGRVSRVKARAVFESFEATWYCPRVGQLLTFFVLVHFVIQYETPQEESRVSASYKPIGLVVVLLRILCLSYSYRGNLLHLQVVHVLRLV
jgi:tetrahydromethanopterin S-methyltransferase subunit E